MFSFLNHFSVFQDFSQELKQNIKLLHVFENIAYCVTNDDKVYGFGKKILVNSFGNIWVLMKVMIIRVVLIHELCDKNIEEFFGNFHAFFARTVTNDIYTWSWSDCGALGRGYVSNKEETPEKNEILSEMNLIKINFHGEYCLALLSDGEILDKKN